MAIHRGMVGWGKRCVRSFVLGLWGLWALTLAAGWVGAQQPQWAEVRVDAKQFGIGAPQSWVVPTDTLPDALNAPVYIRLLDNQYRFGPDAASTEKYTRLVIDGSNAQQLQQECKQVVGFNPQFQRLVLHHAGVWRGGKFVDKLGQTQPRFLTQDTARGSVYQGGVTVLLELPDCRSGDMLDLAWTVHGHNPVFGPQAHAVEQMSLGVPMQLRSVSFTVPSAMPLDVRVLPSDNPQTRRLRPDAATGLRSTDTVVDGWRRVRWYDTAVPAMAVLDSSAWGMTQADLVTATLFADGAALRRWAAALFTQPQPPASPAYKALLQKILAAPTPEERIALALQTVQAQIRYVSVSLGENAFRPAAPDEVLQRGYGDYKDVTLLLVQLLRDAGVVVQPGLMTSFNPRIAARMHAVPWFDHAVALAWVDGRPYALDATLPVQPARLESMAAWHAFKQVLVVDGPEQGFVTIPDAPDPATRTVQRDETMVLDPQGQGGKLRIQITLHGVLAERQRQLMKTTPREQVKAGLLNDLRQLYPNTTWDGEPDYNDDEAHNRIVMGATFAVPVALKRKAGGGYRYEFSDNEVTSRLTPLNDSGRKLPLGLQVDAQQVEFSHTLELPTGVKVEEPGYDETIEAPAFALRVQRSSAPQRISDRYVLRLHADTVPAADMAAYQAALQRVLDLQTTYQVAR